MKLFWNLSYLRKEAACRMKFATHRHEHTYLHWSAPGCRCCRFLLHKGGKMMSLRCVLPVVCLVFRAAKHASPCRAGPARRRAATLPWLQLRLPSRVCPSDTCVALEEMAALGGITSSLRSHDIEILLASGRIRIKPRVGIYKKKTQKTHLLLFATPMGFPLPSIPPLFFPSLTHLSDRTCSHTHTQMAAQHAAFCRSGNTHQSQILQANTSSHLCKMDKETGEGGCKREGECGGGGVMHGLDLGWHRPRTSSSVTAGTEGVPGPRCHAD